MLVHSRDRMVFVRYDPPAIDFAQADRQAKIQGFMFTVDSRFSATHGRDDKSDILAGSDVHFGNIEGYRIARPGKEQVPRLLVSFDSLGLKRWRYIEHDDVR